MLNQLLFCQTITSLHQSKWTYFTFIFLDLDVGGDEIGYSHMMEEKGFGGPGERALGSRRTRLRWFKAYTLIMNPSLRKEKTCDRSWRTEELATEANENMQVNW